MSSLYNLRYYRMIVELYYIIYFNFLEAIESRPVLFIFIDKRV